MEPSYPRLACLGLALLACILAVAESRVATDADKQVILENWSNWEDGEHQPDRSNHQQINEELPVESVDGVGHDIEVDIRNDFDHCKKFNPHRGEYNSILFERRCVGRRIACHIFECADNQNKIKQLLYLRAAYVLCSQYTCRSSNTITDCITSHSVAVGEEIHEAVRHNATLATVLNNEYRTPNGWVQYIDHDLPKDFVRSPYLKPSAIMLNNVCDNGDCESKARTSCHADKSAYHGDDIIPLPMCADIPTVDLEEQCSRMHQNIHSHKTGKGYYYDEKNEN